MGQAFYALHIICDKNYFDTNEQREGSRDAAASHRPHDGVTDDAPPAMSFVPVPRLRGGSKATEGDNAWHR
jgi:hypothetical protein